MRFSVPHPIPYQGSKRRLAAAILSHVEEGRFERLVEPFAGSAAVTLAAARSRKFRRFEIGDRLEQLVVLWQAIIDFPENIANEYERLWMRERMRPIDEFYEVRSQFNEDRDPANLAALKVQVQHVRKG